MDDDEIILEAIKALQRRIAERDARIAELEADRRELRARAKDDARYCREARQRRDADAGHILWLQGQLAAAKAQSSVLQAESDGLDAVFARQERELREQRLQLKAYEATIAGLRRVCGFGQEDDPDES